MAKIKAKKAVEEKVDEKKNKRVKRIKKLKKTKEISFNENNSEIRKFIIIFIVILIIVISFYFISKIVVDNRETTSNQEETKAAEINYDIITVGTLLNRPYKEYYVLAYNGENPKAIYYSSLITSYQNKKDAKKIYYCDLSNRLNSKYVSETSNPSAKSIEELQLGEITLLTIKDGKITSYIENLDTIKNTLQ